ncbi:ParA family protein [Cellulosimicrobium cellulans]|uniref:ParA family protein n=1 Tax=Cellulosimicrobium cellulans TaxID=1710 RepID=UPI001C9E2EE1|nr:ParA family protein [Cellulosimicrobium cellulans]
MISEQLDKVLETHRRVVEEGYSAPTSGLKHSKYAISTLRGGVGKSTLSFNLTYEMAKISPILAADVCAQRNLTETLLDDFEPQVDIVKALEPVLLGPAFGQAPSDVTYRVSRYCDAFKSVEPAYIVPGSAEMFAFPSQLYQQLQTAHSNQRPDAVRALLESLSGVLSKQAADVGAEVTLMDTSPFYSGGTHLAWVAADAIVIPVRVDEHSLDSLELTLDMLTNPAKDFQMWNDRAGGRPTPKVAAIVMTMVGSKSRIASTPDRASRMYIERAIEIANRYPQVFEAEDPADVIVVTDDFVSSGRISGAKAVPIAQLRVGSFHTVEGKRLQVNSSVTRYQSELKYLASIL